MVGAAVSDEARDWFVEHVGEAEYDGVCTCDPRQSEDILQAAAPELRVSRSDRVLHTHEIEQFARVIEEGTDA